MLRQILEIIKPGLSIARYALGKYIILAASVLHIYWAVLLAIDARAANATPVSILYFLFGHSRLETIVMLLAISVSSIAFLNFRLRKRIGGLQLTLLLLPQQIILWCSAGAGIYAGCRQHYADGTPMSWPHIMADQGASLIIALLFTVAMVESLYGPKPYRTLR